jgi:hypothetical protein
VTLTDESGNVQLRIDDRVERSLAHDALAACFVRAEGVPEVPADTACWASRVLQ